MHRKGVHLPKANERKACISLVLPFYDPTLSMHLTKETDEQFGRWGQRVAPFLARLDRPGEQAIHSPRDGSSAGKQEP